MIKQTMVTFPDRPAGNEKLYHTLDLINDQEAERTYSIGRLLQTTGKVASAEYYFGKVRQRWPKSPWATKAKTELAVARQDAPQDASTPSKIMSQPGAIDPFTSGMGGMGGGGMGGMDGMGPGGMGGMGGMGGWDGTGRHDVMLRADAAADPVVDPKEGRSHGRSDRSSLRRRRDVLRRCAAVGLVRRRGLRLLGPAPRTTPASRPSTCRSSARSRSAAISACS